LLGGAAVTFVADDGELPGATGAGGKTAVGTLFEGYRAGFGVVPEAELVFDRRVQGQFDGGFPGVGGGLR
jgi:hypothetical protein